MSAFTTHIFQAKVPERFNRDFGAGRRVVGVVSREYKPAAAPRVQFVNPLVGCSGPRGSWASTLSQSSLEERYVRVQQSQQYPPRADRGQAARWVILSTGSHTA